MISMGLCVTYSFSLLLYDSLIKETSVGYMIQHLRLFCIKANQYSNEVRKEKGEGEKTKSKAGKNESDSSIRIKRLKREKMCVR